MAHYASKRFNYWEQAGMLVGICGAGLLIGGVVSVLPLIGKVDIWHIKSIDNLLIPANATALRWMQFLSTLFLFFIPTFIYAQICNKKAAVNLGFKHTVTIQQILLVIVIMLAALPIVSILQQLTEMLPFSKATFLEFKKADIDYAKEVAVIARMNNFTDFVVSAFVIALLPAVFEETFFRGGVQNLLSRWTKMPIISIIITSIIFSAVHGSYLGFLSRFALSFILGWMYYRTGNIWLNITAHFTNNFLAVTSLYIMSLSTTKVAVSKLDENFPLWAGIISIGAVCGLFIFFEKASKKDIYKPGEEVNIDEDINIQNPVLVQIQNMGNDNFNNTLL